jgi:hypothetical protein
VDIIIIASTLNINTVNYSPMEYVITPLKNLLFSNSWYMDNFLCSPAKYIIKKLKSDLRVTLDGTFLQMENVEREIIEKKFEDMLKKENYSDPANIHPALQHLFSVITCRTILN